MLITTECIVRELLSTHNGKKRDGGDWQKITLLVELPASFRQKPKSLAVDFFSGDGPVVNAPQIGERISLTCSVEASQYNGKWFNNLRAYSYETIYSTPANSRDKW